MSSESGAAQALQSLLVPIDTLEKIADAAAFEVWGENIGRGEPIPLSDGSGTYAYVFPYIVNTKEFPPAESVFRHIRALRERFHVVAGEEHVPAAYYSELRQFGRGFGSVCVSVKSTDGPVLWVSHFLPSVYVTGEAVKEEANRRLGGEATLINHYYFSPEEQYSEFESGGRTVLLDAIVPGRSVPAAVPAGRSRELKSDQTAMDIRKSWEAISGGATLTLAPGAGVLPAGLDVAALSGVVTEKKMDYWELIPIVDHTPKHWCVVASKAMVLGFYDNYVNGKGTLLGFGRFIDYWYELTPGGYNVPNLADEMIPPNDASKINGYTWNWTETGPDKVKAWNTLKAEIDAGRPCFFSITGHTTAAFGYRIDSNGAKFAIVYDPPNPSVPTYVNQYNFVTCTGVGAVTPTGGTPGHNLILIEPDGGDTFRTSVPNEIIWFVWGNSITKTRVSLSEDGGNSWQIVADGIPTKGAWNGYAWIAANSGTRIRMKVEGLTASNALIAADGSFHNLQVGTSKSGTAWKKIWGPTESVVARSLAGKPDLLMYGVPSGADGIYRYDGSPLAWTRIGGPGKMFALDNNGQLYGLSPDGGGVFRYDGTPMKWTQVGGPAGAIYAGGSLLFATNPQTGDIWQYGGKPMTWTKVGGPGKTFTVDAKGRLYGVSPDGSAIYRYDGVPMAWTKVAGPSSAAWAGGCGLYATAGNNNDVYYYSLAPLLWTKVGGPGKMFAVDDTGRVYGLSPDGSGVFRYDGAWNAPQEWTKVGGAAGKIFAGGIGRLFATNPQTEDLMSFE